MANLQKILESLQPYVIGIRYLQGTTLVDIVLTEGWTLPEDSKIIRTKGDESMNYHMIHSDEPEIGLDELLAYVEKTIKLNLEREKKHELLKEKVNQLKELFRKNPLVKLERLKFTFGEEDFLTSVGDIDIDLDEEKVVKNITPQIKEENFVENTINEPINNQTTAYLDADGKPIILTEEEEELAAEEARAARNLKILQDKKQNKGPSIAKKIELPPKRQPVMQSVGGCECGEGEACNNCIDSKYN